jgi:hypothetical protein
MKRRQLRQMNRQSIGGNRRSNRSSSLNKTETRQDQRSSTRWTNGSAVVYLTVMWKLTETFWPWGLQHRMNRRTVGAKRQCSSHRELQRLRDVGGAPDEPMLLKSNHRFIRRSTFQWAVSQQLAECLGLFIAPPLTHLRVLDYVEVLRSSRHIEDHIQSIQVLNCSSLDLHMLCVCA